MSKTKVKYPECEKLQETAWLSQAIGEFLDWAENEKNYRFWNSDGTPLHYSIEKILADYFDIDLKKVEKERQKILADVRKGKL